MNPKQFLIIGGIILLVLGLGGLVLPEPLGDKATSPGSLLYFDAGENVAHTVLGIVALVAAFVIPATLQKWLAVVVGIVALFFGVAGFAVAGRDAPNFFGLTNLENPVDNVLHLVVGVWALLAAFVLGRGTQARAS